MMGTPTNDWDGAFWRADVDEAASVLLEIIKDVRPQVLVTYDSNGFYGHPDHIQAHRVAWRAFEMSDGLVRKFYATAVPKSVLAEGMSQMRGAQTRAAQTRAAQTSSGSVFETVESVDDLPFGVPDQHVTTEIDAGDYLAAKLAAMRAHASQIAVDSPFFALSDGVGQRAFGHEYYTLLAGPRGAGGGGHGWESDLFAGIDDAGID
jgi:N-acetyl-1-D-myo-inositol-2-amino-2-deoxy-alpha-D-glucopyranoside deacetylase